MFVKSSLVLIKATYVVIIIIPKSTSDPLIVTRNIIPRRTAWYVHVNQRRDVSQGKPMTFCGDVRPHYSDPLCSPQEFPRRTGNDTTNTARYGSRGEDYIINSPERLQHLMGSRAVKVPSRPVNLTTIYTYILGISDIATGANGTRRSLSSDDKCVCTVLNHRTVLENLLFQVAIFDPPLFDNVN